MGVNIPIAAVALGPRVNGVGRDGGDAVQHRLALRVGRHAEAKLLALVVPRYVLNPYAESSVSVAGVDLAGGVAGHFQLRLVGHFAAVLIH